MNTEELEIDRQVKTYCARIGKDPLLVQGAGGNASWKDGSVLWVKASGTWLAEANEKDIFVPVDLAHLRKGLSAGQFDLTPNCIGDTLLRPSIETLLHALMPHKVVLHLHPVEILAHLVRIHPLAALEKLIDEAVTWCLVDYYKPGAALAEAVAGHLNKQPDTQVVFLRNHGVVIGGDCIAEIEHTLTQLVSRLETRIVAKSDISISKSRDDDFCVTGYRVCEDNDLNQLSLKRELFSRLTTDWAIFPDHLVYLGEKATVFSGDGGGQGLRDVAISNSPYIFIFGKGTFESVSITETQIKQLRCYYDVMVRQSACDEINSLREDQIFELLDWDAEKYRQNLAQIQRRENIQQGQE